MKIPEQSKHSSGFMDIVFKLLVQDQTYSNVEMANYLLSSRKWAIENENTELRIRLIFHSVDGMEHRVDISGAETIHEFSSILKRADIGTSILLFVKRIPDRDKATIEDDFWEVTTCFKRAPDRWFLTVVF